MRTFCRTAGFALLMLAIGGPGCSRGDAMQTDPPDPGDIVAQVGDRAFTLQEIDEAALQESASQFSGTLRHALYEARRQTIDKLVADELLALEAKARGVTATELFTQEVTRAAAPVTQADIEGWYRDNPQRVQGATLAQVQDAIRELLTRERQQATSDALVARLKAKTAVRIMLEAPRLAIETTAAEPALGPRDAKVEIVEYSDFQCPFCASAEPTIEQVLRTYGEKVRLVYRDFPLPNHAQAFKAAEAAQCANAQGRFWDYHEKLFANFGRLSADQLRQYATDIGLDVREFSACLDGSRMRDAVQQDLDQGQEHGVSATPTFFINGRLVSGAQPFSVFKQVIDEELERR